MPRVNHVDVRNYKEPFLVIKWVRNNSDGLESAREFSSRFVYGSIMRDRNIATSPNERSETEVLSIKVLNIGTYIDVGDLIYRAKKVFQITAIDSDQFNRQEQHIKATYVSDIEKQPDLFEYVKKLPFNESVKKGGFAYVDWVNSEIKKLTTKDEDLLSQINANVEQLQAKDSELNKQIAQTTENLTQLINKNTSNDEKTQGSIKTLSSDLNEFKSQINANVEQLQAKDSELNKQIAQTNEILDDRTVKITESVVEVEQKLTKNIKTVSDGIKELEQKHKGDIFSVNSEIAQNKEQITDIKDDISRTKQEYNVLFDNVKQDVTNLTKQVNSNTEKAISQGATVLQLEQDNETIQTRLREITEKNNTQDLAIESMQKLQEVGNSKILEVDRKREENVSSLSSQIEKVSATNEEQSELINKLQLALTANTEADSETLRKFNQLSEENKQKHVELHVKVAGIERANQQILEKTNKIDTIDNSVNVLNSKQARWDTVASQFDEFKHMSIENGRQFRQFKNKTTEEQERQKDILSGLRASVKEVADRRISQKINSMFERLVKLEEKANSLNARFGDVERKADDANKHLGSVRFEVEWEQIGNITKDNPTPGTVIGSFGNISSGDANHIYLFAFNFKVYGRWFAYQYLQLQKNDKDYRNVIMAPIHTDKEWDNDTLANDPDYLILSVSDGRVKYHGATSARWGDIKMRDRGLEQVEVTVYKQTYNLIKPW
ncbi:hypothetical protein MBVG596_0381 [Mycoplasmopsis bovigenitalium]|uniref:hypothetical protein n=1 Tax=Mycoplasmopsis bovigenitalium TaxID=2112 RepID=UPI00090A8EDA|nr:hypothetical protein [Mycoplasmopsis bovigenitalium]BAW18188.1 hypothetical protein MBVG596_0381 [Mycoplasmopsis bovigenitalium]